MHEQAGAACLSWTTYVLSPSQVGSDHQIRTCIASQDQDQGQAFETRLGPCPSFPCSQMQGRKMQASVPSECSSECLQAITAQRGCLDMCMCIAVMSSLRVLVDHNSEVHALTCSFCVTSGRAQGSRYKCSQWSQEGYLKTANRFGVVIGQKVYESTLWSTFQSSLL